MRKELCGSYLESQFDSVVWGECLLLNGGSPRCLKNEAVSHSKKLHRNGRHCL
jgi:hypothetical protein